MWDMDAAGDKQGQEGVGLAGRGEKSEEGRRVRRGSEVQRKDTNTEYDCGEYEMAYM